MSDDLMLSCSFNQTKTLFSIGTIKGFRIYRINSDNQNITNRLTLYDKILEGGISIAELYYESNLIILVGGSKIPKFQKNKVVFWDEEKSKITNELVFNNFIKNVKVKKDFVFISTETSLHVISLLSLQAYDVIDISNIPKYCKQKGIFAINYSNNQTILCCPDSNQGCVKIKNYDESTSIILNAHNSPIAFLQLSYDGNILATASERGNVVRLFRTSDGYMIGRLRISKSGTKICYIAFEDSNDFLSINCTNGEIVVFDISLIKKSAYPTRKESSSGPMKFNSFKVKEIQRADINRKKTFLEKLSLEDTSIQAYSRFYIKQAKSISCFIDKPVLSIGVVSSDGIYYEAIVEKDVCKKTYEISLNLTEYNIKNLI